MPEIMVFLALFLTFLGFWGLLVCGPKSGKIEVYYPHYYNNETVTTLKPPLHKGCGCSVAKGAPRDLKGQNKSDILPYTVDDERWKRAEFSNEQRLKRHFRKHGKDVGAQNIEEYLDVARRVMSAPLSDDVLGMVLENGDVVKYIRSENLLAEGTKSGVIRTCFFSDKGEQKYVEKTKK